MKFKVKRKKTYIKIKSRLSRHEKVNTREMEIFSKRLIRGLMIPKTLNSRSIEYTAQADISLKDFLNRRITKNDFFLIVAQIAEIEKYVEKNALNRNNLVLNSKFIFVDSKTSMLSFIYQPIISDNVSTSIYSVISDIVFHIKPKKEEDSTYLKEFSSFLSRAKFGPTTDIEKYIKFKHPQTYTQLMSQGTVHKQKTTSEYSGSAEGLSLLQNEGTSLLQDEGTSLLQDEGTSLLQDEGTSLLQDEGTSLLQDEGTSLLGDFSEEGTSLLSDYEGTKLFGDKPDEYPYLIRLSTYDHIDINKPVFRIGKERNYVDFFVPNNNAISRLHADIIVQGKNFFIRDNNSTNRTFVNGIVIAPDRDFQIFDGDQIMLANEAFEFHIK